MAADTQSPPAGVLVTGHFREGPGYAVRRAHGSGNWLVTYTVAGHGLYRQAGLSLLTHAGDLVLLQPGAEHDYSVPEGELWEFLWAHFHPEISWLSWLHLPPVGTGLSRASLRSGTSRERALQAFLRLHADACASGAMRQELAMNGLEELLLLAVSECDPWGRHQLDPRIAHVLGVISNDLRAEHSVESLAREVALSPSRLSHLFKEQVGDSLVNTLLVLRLRQAARLLEFTDRPVGAIAEDVGFSSSFYFARQFRRRYGASPREYRQGSRRGAGDRHP